MSKLFHMYNLILPPNSYCYVVELVNILFSMLIHKSHHLIWEKFGAEFGAHLIRISINTRYSKLQKPYSIALYRIL